MNPLIVLLLLGHSHIHTRLLVHHLLLIGLHHLLRVHLLLLAHLRIDLNGLLLRLHHNLLLRLLVLDSSIFWLADPKCL
jgi:hypothetical protein